MRRRDMLRAGGSAAALYGLRPPVAAATGLPDRGLLTRDPEQYWGRLRAEQFLLPEWRIFLNNGSLGVAPKPVVETVAASLARAATLESDEYPRWGYETLDNYRAEMAAFLGCAKEELALTHNATEAMSFVAAGVDLRAGDEVLITDQEHPSGRNPWLLRQTRTGITVRQVKLPLPPRDAGQLADVVTSSAGPRTRILSFSGITTTTGLILPVREICRAARAKGILSVVDGAHMPGQVAVNLRDLECDFFVGSPHKWLFTPAGCGFLYGRDDAFGRLLPSVATGGWDDKALRGARFMMVGTNNRAIFDGLLAGLRFHQQIGPDAIFARMDHLSRLVYENAARRPYLELLTPEDHSLYRALVAFRLRSGDLKPLFEECRKRRIWILQGERLRISTHIHTRPSDIDAFFAVTDSLYG